jgi:elongation factor P
MKISGVDIRPGNILEYEKGIWKVAKIQHTQPGKGGAYMQVEMKNLQDGRKTNVRFRSADTIEKVRLETKDYQFLFQDGDALVFMDQENYEQINLDTDLLGDERPFLEDGMVVVLELWEDRPISVQLPDQIEATIVEADAVVKGQTASSSYKPARTRERRPHDGPAAYRERHPDRRRCLCAQLCRQGRLSATLCPGAPHVCGWPRVERTGRPCQPYPD